MLAGSGSRLACATKMLTIGLLDATSVCAHPTRRSCPQRWVTASIPSTSANASIVLQATPIISQQAVKWGFSGPFFMPSGTGVVTMSSGAFSTYGPGESPHINIFASGNSATDGHWSHE